MKKIRTARIGGLLVFLIVVLFSLQPAAPTASPDPIEIMQGPNAEKLMGCTSFVAGKEAIGGGYTMSGHTCDGNCDWRLQVIPAAKHQPLQGPNADTYVIDYPGIPGGVRTYGAGRDPGSAADLQVFLYRVPVR